MRYVLLDTHAILHRAYHALPDFATSKGTPTGALYGMILMIMQIVERLKPDYVIATYDLPQKTHRHEVYEAYKSGRKKPDEALIEQINLSRNVCTAFCIPMYEVPGFEADDILGTLVEKIPECVKDKDLEIIIASGDMDTMQLIKGECVKVFTLKKGLNDTILYDEAAVRARFGFGPNQIPDYKGLRGDPSDNIIGIKGVGEKTATSLILEFGTVEEMYKSLEMGEEERFKKAGITPRMFELLKNNREEAEFSKILATIRRDAPITFEQPKKTFKEAFDIKLLESLCQEFEFRSLIQRLRVMAGAEGVKQEAREIIQENIDDKLIPETAVALWLLDSNKTAPTLDDIRAFSAEGTFEASRKRIFEVMPPKVKEVFETIEKPLIPIVKEMNERGILIDCKYLRNLCKEYKEKLEGIRTKIIELAGEDFNVGSPKQLSKILFEKLQIGKGRLKKTGTGQVSTREAELLKYVDAHPIISLILEYRELDKLIGTYLDTIPDKVDSENRLHTTFVPAGTTTGRMSSQDPNLQNIPIKTEQGNQIRKGFIATPGFCLLALDYSQMELRIAAFLSADEKMLDIFRRGDDFHTAVASEVFKVPQSEVTSEMRRKAKIINFGIMYGMGVNALKDNLKTDKEAAQAFLSNYFTVFADLASYFEKVKAFAKEHGYTETYFGRRRYVEGIKSKIPYVQAAAERMAINAPIQGTEADLVKLAMVRINEYIKKNKIEAYPLLQVHDEVVYEVKEKEAEKLAEEFKKLMESLIDPKDIYGISCVAEAAIGKNWAEMKEV